MIEVKIILHSAITHTSQEIGRMYIANDGTGTPDRGNYDVAICKKGKQAIPSPMFPGGTPAYRTGEVKDYPRRSYNVWRLITRALKSCFPEEAK